MSTFPGQISELPGISVDCFNDANLKSSVFFLSHCHSDHMEGLGNSFFQSLAKSNKYLYCSPISKSFLLGMFPGLVEDQLKDLEISIPKTINYTTSEGDKSLSISVTVTTLPAGHCPGSVMFIFNIDEKTVLYTGDFRINPDDLTKLNPLNNKIDGKNHPKKFTAIYLDTTFLTPDFPTFPTRRESCDEISKAIRQWLNSNPKNVVILECSALYGAEYLFIEVFKHLKLKIHVKDKVYFNYMRISELSECVTSDGTSTSIHACNSKMSGNKLCCRFDVDARNILTIVPSAMRWRGRKASDRIVEYDPTVSQRLYVCYSMHASFEELIAFINYFKPEKIVPCVCPPNSMNQIYNLLSQLTSYRLQAAPEETPLNLKPLLPHSRNSKESFKSKYFNDDDDDDL